MARKHQPDDVLDVGDAKKARRWLEKRVGSISDELWEWAYEGGQFRGFDVDGDPDEQEDWVEAVAELLPVDAGRRRGKSIRPGVVAEPVERYGSAPDAEEFLTAYERDRLVGFSRKTAEQVAGLEWVQNFRRIVFAGRLLSDTEADRFITSP